MQLKAIDLFCGIGGFHLALDACGVQTVFASEINRQAADTYFNNFGLRPDGDITKVNPCDIPPFDIITAGFPCQPFSTAGLKRGFEDKTRGTLFFDVCRIAAARRPKMILLENVKGIVRHDGGRTLRAILDCLQEIGYTAHWQVVDSIRYGLAQQRERFYCAAFDRDVPFLFPQFAKPPKRIKDILDPAADGRPDLQLPASVNARLDHHFARAKAPYVRVPHPDWRSVPGSCSDRIGVFSKLLRNGKLRFELGNGFPIQRYLFCSVDTPANTLIADPSNPIMLHDLRRRLSPLEMRRLQGFPDGFKMSENPNAAQRQLGNAVSVPVVASIIEGMIKAYERARNAGAPTAVNAPLHAR